jgi:hypothetical protein
MNNATLNPGFMSYVRHTSAQESLLFVPRSAPVAMLLNPTQARLGLSSVAPEQSLNNEVGVSPKRLHLPSSILAGTSEFSDYKLTDFK